ncbi:MAG TPA: EI24 domain-containing protein [Propionicimonas sp.]|nr:EI24 domain-containing protein [Propionicimonas sp.]
MRVTESALATTREFFDGVALFFRSIGVMAHRPRLYLLGIIPGVISVLILAAAIASVTLGMDAEVRVLTGFAHGWAPWLRSTVDIAARVAVVGLSVLISIWAFTSLALLLGQPFFERISSALDDEAGVPDGPPSTLWNDLLTGLREALRVGALVAVVGLGLFIAGFIPLVGQTVVPVIVALFGGWTLMVELTGTPFARRGLALTQRRIRLRQHRAHVLGLGVALFVVFLIPLGAVLFMPVAVAAATVLTQQITALTGRDDIDVAADPSAGAPPQQH